MIALTKGKLEPDDARAVSEAVLAGSSGYGPVAAAFETACAELFGTPGAIATGSCTAALILALRALDIGLGDEVILPSYTCLAVLNAVVSVGATARLADNACHPLRMDFNMTAAHAEARRSTRTRAVVVPHMFGVTADIRPFRELGVPIIEDVTLSLGARREGLLAGTVGDVTVCSFHESKMLSCGEGGIFATPRPDLLARARRLSGFEVEQAELRTREGVLAPYELRYSSHLSDLSAALGLSQWKKLHAFIATRRALAARYTQTLRGLTCLLPEPDAGAVFHRYMVGVPGRSVIAILEAFARAGVEVGRGVYPPLHRYLRESDTDFPGAVRAVQTMISIPLYPALTESEIDHLLSVSRAVLA